MLHVQPANRGLIVDMTKQSENNSALPPAPSPAPRQPTFSASEMLTPSEQEQLRQHKNELIDFGLKAWPTPAKS